MVKSIGVLGLGKLGYSTATVLSQHFPVVGYDPKVKEHLSNHPEPQVVDMCRLHPFKIASTVEDVAACDCVFIIVPTPTDSSGGFSNDYIMRCFNELLPYIKTRGTPIHLNIVSTVLPGSMSKFKHYWSQNNCGSTVMLSYNPEFINLGNIVDELLNPDFVLIGAEDVVTINNLFKIYTKVCGDIVKFKIMTALEAEITKLSLNVMLNAKITLANYIATQAMLIGNDLHEPVDGRVVCDAIGTDHRIGSALFKPGWFAGGPCLPRDLVAYEYVCVPTGETAELPEWLISTNQDIQDGLVNDIMNDTSPNDCILVTDPCYKPGSYTEEMCGPCDLISKLRDGGRTVLPMKPCHQMSTEDIVAAIKVATYIVISFQSTQLELLVKSHKRADAKVRVVQ